jgi:uncharacterized repeat protein (TIGR03803 family)
MNLFKFHDWWACGRKTLRNCYTLATMGTNRIRLAVFYRLDCGTMYCTLLAFALGFLLLAVEPSNAQTETVIDNFNERFPGAPLVMDGQGRLYGTTEGGGHGTIFELKPPKVAGDAWIETLVHTFAGAPGDGSSPHAGLIMDSGHNFYGTTLEGGTNDEGTVFEITSTGKEKLLYSFKGSGGDGFLPYASLVRGSNGSLYGATSRGGASDSGEVFEITSAGVYSIIYSFRDNPDGADPVASLIIDSAGNLYGTTESGGTRGTGTVFELTPQPGGTWTEKVLHSFTGTPDGMTPVSSLVSDSAGNLYGTTEYGGKNRFGTIFEWTSAGLEILYSFKGGATDGNFPQAGLLRDRKGNFYGTTGVAGGSGNDGTVFDLTSALTEKVLHIFTSSPDGYGPQAPVIMDSKHNLYGTTFEGGLHNGGTVFELVPLR